MAILCGDAPRQSDYVVKDGKRYKLLYEKKEMVLEVRIIMEIVAPPLPPKYEEVSGGEASGKKVLESDTSTNSGAGVRA